MSPAARPRRGLGGASQHELELARRGQQAGDLLADEAGQPPERPALGQAFVLRARPVDVDQAERRAARAVAEHAHVAVCLVGPLDGRVGDRAVAEPLGHGEDPVESLEQHGDRAEVGVEGVEHAGAEALDQGVASLEVGIDVGAAETVDGLLGVADQEEPLGTVVVLDEDAAEDLPLDGIGVLELVHQREPVLGAEGGEQNPRPFGIGGQGVADADQHVVEIDQPVLLLVVRVGGLQSPDRGLHDARSGIRDQQSGAPDGGNQLVFQKRDRLAQDRAFRGGRDAAVGQAQGGGDERAEAAPAVVVALQETGHSQCPRTRRRTRAESLRPRSGRPMARVPPR